MRALLWRRYRDQHAYVLSEYRHTFKKGDGLSKHGFVIWTAVGEIWSEKMEIDNALPVVGLGYRFALQPHINAHFGIGRQSTGFYMNITEAF